MAGVIIHARPSTLLLPVLVFCLLCGVGCWAVVFASNSNELDAEGLAQVGANPADCMPCLHVIWLKAIAPACM